MPGAFRRAGASAGARDLRSVAAPQTLPLKRHRDLMGRRWFVPVRRVLLALLTALLVLALLNMFGQRPVATSAATAAAKLTVYAPSHARSGVVYAARFHIKAYKDLKNATLVLDPGWAEGYTVNGTAPQPLTSGSRDGRLVFGFAQSDYSVTGIYLAAGTIGLLATLTAFVTYKSQRLKRIVEGEPVILVERGEAIEKNLRAERLSLEDLMEQARGQQIESLDQVKWAVLERSGAISFIENQ